WRPQVSREPRPTTPADLAPSPDYINTPPANPTAPSDLVRFFVPAYRPTSLNAKMLHHHLSPESECWGVLTSPTRCTTKRRPSRRSSTPAGTSRRSRASTDLPTIAERFSSFLAKPSRVDSVMARNRWGLTSRTIRASMSGTLVLRV